MKELLKKYVEELTKLKNNKQLTRENEKELEKKLGVDQIDYNEHREFYTVTRMILWNEKEDGLEISNITFHVEATVKLIKELGYRKIYYSDSSTEAIEYVHYLTANGYKLAKSTIDESGKITLEFEM